MESFKKGFYITSQKKERKPGITLGTSSYTQPQHFSNKQPGIQQEKWKQPKKTKYTETPILEEQPRKQIKSALQHKISEFNPSGQMSMEQLIKVVLNLQEEVQKLKHLNEKLILKLEEKNKMDESRIDNYELNGCIPQHAKSLGYEHDQAEGFCYKIRIGNLISQRVKNGTTKHWIDPNDCRTLSLTSDETNPDQEEMFLLRKSTTPLSKLSEVSIEAMGFLISKANRKNQIEQDFQQQEWKHVQEEEGSKIKT